MQITKFSSLLSRSLLSIQLQQSSGMKIYTVINLVILSTLTLLIFYQVSLIYRIFWLGYGNGAFQGL